MAKNAGVQPDGTGSHRIAIGGDGGAVHRPGRVRVGGCRGAERGEGEHLSMANKTDSTPVAPADSHDLIRVQGARENNLKDVSVEIPKRRLTVFTGVSGLGQELAGVRHDRRGVAADDQRDLQRLRAGLHADPGPTRGRPARGPDDGDHRRPGADGREPALHRRHRHRRQRHAPDPVQPARQAVRRAADGVLVQRPDPQGERGDEHREGRRPGREGRGAERRLPGRHVPALRGHGLGLRLRPHRAVRRDASRSATAR